MLVATYTAHKQEAVAVPEAPRVMRPEASTRVLEALVEVRSPALAILGGELGLAPEGRGGGVQTFTQSAFLH